LLRQIRPPGRGPGPRTLLDLGAPLVNRSFQTQKGSSRPVSSPHQAPARACDPQPPLGRLLRRTRWPGGDLPGWAYTNRAKTYFGAPRKPWRSSSSSPLGPNCLLMTRMPIGTGPAVKPFVSLFVFMEGRTLARRRPLFGLLEGLGGHLPPPRALPFDKLLRQNRLTGRGPGPNTLLDLVAPPLVGRSFHTREKKLPAAVAQFDVDDFDSGAALAIKNSARGCSRAGQHVSSLLAGAVRLRRGRAHDCPRRGILPGLVLELVVGPRAVQNYKIPSSRTIPDVLGAHGEEGHSRFPGAPPRMY
jgi:hypothetical protein